MNLVEAQAEAKQRAKEHGHEARDWTDADDGRVSAAACVLCGCELMVDLDDEDPVGGNATRSDCFLRGVDRVLLDREGTATTPLLAAVRNGVRAEVVFVRDDGWKIGAPKRLEDVARSLWPDQWVEVRRL